MSKRKNVVKGTSFEKLVKTYEELLAPYDVKVEHNVQAPSVFTGNSRQIDITIRGKIGSVNVLIVIECRDRKKPQDITWIEQLMGKRINIGADKVIAVSSSGFTEEAIKHAKLSNIELRTINEIKNPKVVEGWMADLSPVFSGVLMAYKVIIMKFLTDQDHYSLEIPRYDENGNEINIKEAKIFKKQNGCKTSIEEIVNNIDYGKLVSDFDCYFNECKDSDYKLGVCMKLDSSLFKEKVIAMTSLGEIELEYIWIDALLWLEKIDAKLKSVKRYITTDKTLVETAEFEAINGPFLCNLDAHYLLDNGTIVVDVKERVLKRNKNDKDSFYK
jgi:hypothetical protein